MRFRVGDYVEIDPLAFTSCGFSQRETKRDLEQTLGRGPWKVRKMTIRGVCLKGSAMAICTEHFRLVKRESINEKNQRLLQGKKV